jgi:hypothetical protein
LLPKLANTIFRLELAEFLGSLETELSRSTGVKEHLQTQVARIDEYMETQRARDILHRNIGQDMHGVVSRVEPSPSNVQFPNPSFTEFSGDLGQEWQIPPELLEGWPWLFDFTHGLIDYPGAVSRD